MSCALAVLVLVLGLAETSRAQTVGPWHGPEGNGREAPPARSEESSAAANHAVPVRSLAIPSADWATEDNADLPWRWLSSRIASAFHLPGTSAPDTSRPDVQTLISRRLFGTAGFRAARNPAALAGVRRIPRTFVPIPLLPWKPHLQVGRSAHLAVNPSIVLGRRLTSDPAMSRGGRTLGVAIEMKLRFDRPAATAPRPTPRGVFSGGAILSKVIGMLEKRGG